MNRERMKKIGRLIFKKRKALNLTQGQLSEMLYVTPQAVHLWESGKRYPDADSLVMIHKVLGLNPVELLIGLEMFDEELKKGIDSFMHRIDEEVFVAGTFEDEDGNEEYVDFSDYEIVMSDKEGNLTDKWIPFTDYYNVERPEKTTIDSSDVPKTPYDPAKIYLNHGHSILTIPVELLKELGNPLYFSICRKNCDLLIIFEDKMSENGFDIPEEVYNGKLKGVQVHGGEFGHALCIEMGVRHCLDLLEVTPEIITDRKIIVIHLDEIKRSTADIKAAKFLLPQWQYEELLEEEDEECD
ncbi:MAG: helix-turn-helix transcriptional regulator [Ruminococcus flavefaciens]